MQQVAKKDGIRECLLEVHHFRLITFDLVCNLDRITIGQLLVPLANPLLAADNLGKQEALIAIIQAECLFLWAMAP